MHLCPRNAATCRNRPRLPSKACKLTATLTAKAFSPAGQAASALHAMAILQARPQSARRHGRPPASSRAAPPQAESTLRPARRASRRRAVPPCVPARPQVVQEVDEVALTRATRRCWSLLFLRRWREQRCSFPRRRAGRRFLCFCSAAGPRASGTHFLKKEPFPFPPGSQVHGTTVCDALLPHSRPWPTFASSQESTVRGQCTSPRTSGQSRLGPREFGEDISERTAFCTIHPYSLSLHHYWYVDCVVGAACTLSGGMAHAAQPVSLAHAHNSTRLLRFSSPGWPPKFNAFSRRRWQSGMPLSCARRLLSSWQRMQSSLSLQPRWGRGFTALTSSYPRKVVNNQSWISESQTGLAQAPVQDADAQVHYQMHPAPGLVCSDRPEGRLHSCFNPSVTQTVPTVCVRGSGMVVQGPPPRALPFSPCLYEGRRGRPYPASGSGRQGPQLPRRLAYLGPIHRAVGWSQGLGASAPQPVGASGQLGKEQALPRAENLFSRCGVRLGEYDGTPHGGTCPSSAELPEFLQRQECGTTETVSEAPGHINCLEL